MLSTRLCTGYSFFDGKAGFLYNGMVNIRLDFPCQREFFCFEIDFVGLALSGWAPVDVNLSTSQGKPTSRSTVGIQI